MCKKKWKFFVETDAGSGYLACDGQIVKNKAEVPDFVGLDNDADKEADRRANAYENRTGLFCNQINYESQGKIGTETKTGKQPNLF